MRTFDIFFGVIPDKLLKQHPRLLVIGDAMTLMWRYCNHLVIKLLADIAIFHIFKKCYDNNNKNTNNGNDENMISQKQK